MERVGYVLQQTSPADCVFEGFPRFNVFRPDIDYIWFSLHPGNGLDAYRTVRPRSFEIGNLIEEKQPKVIVTAALPELAQLPYVRAHYRRSERFPEVLLRSP